MLNMPTVTDPYKKPDMRYAVEGYCPNCGSSESLDVTKPAGTDQIVETDPVADWFVEEIMHCNKCGRDFRQSYAMQFDGQVCAAHTYDIKDSRQDAIELLVRDLEHYIEGVDDAAVDDPRLQQVRQRLTNLKPYLE